MKKHNNPLRNQELKEYFDSSILFEMFFNLLRLRNGQLIELKMKIDIRNVEVLLPYSKWDTNKGRLIQLAKKKTAKEFQFSLYNDDVILNVRNNPQAGVDSFEDKFTLEYKINEIDEYKEIELIDIVEDFYLKSGVIDDNLLAFLEADVNVIKSQDAGCHIFVDNINYNDTNTKHGIRYVVLNGIFTKILKMIKNLNKDLKFRNGKIAQIDKF